MIPVNQPYLGDEEKRLLQECIDTGWISSEGPFIAQLEEGVAAVCGRRHGVAVANGTAALEVAVQALGIGPGDEVILPSLTIISCAGAIVRAGAMPVPVDSDPETWNIDPAQIEARITPRTKAIMVVHLYGLPVDMDPVLALAERHNLAVIEDAAEQLGQTYKSRPIGGFGTISTLSFYPNKHVTTGEGGMILANDEALAERCRSLRNLCFGRRDRFVHEELGWNYRMSNLQAAVGVAQLRRLPESIKRKREIGNLYRTLLEPTDRFCLPPHRTAYAENIYWVFGLVLDPSGGINAREAMARLQVRGVQTRPFFYPMHRQPVFLKRGWFEGLKLPVSEQLAEYGFYLPSGLGLDDGQIREAARSFLEILA